MVEGASLFGQTFQGAKNFRLLSVTQLVEQRFNPSRCFFGLWVKFTCDVPQMFGGVIEIQLAQRANESVRDDVPDPNCAIAHQEDILGFGHASAQRLRMDRASELLRWGARMDSDPELFQDLSAR